MALACSFCNRSVREVAKLIQGPSVNICNVCVDSSRAVLSGESVQDWAVISGGSCQFCGRATAQKRHVVEKVDRDVRICENCVKLCDEVLTEEAKQRESQE